MSTPGHRALQNRKGRKEMNGKESKEPQWAVYLFIKGNWFPISYGDSELECQMWLKSKKNEPMIQQYRVAVGFITEVKL